MKFAKFSKGLLLFTILLLSSICAGSVPVPAKRHTVNLRSIQAGPTPFISFVFFTPGQLFALKSVQFSVAPKPGSVTRPVSVSYSKNYLLGRGFISGQVPEIMLPVFGLYADYLNTVTITLSFMDGSTQQFDAVIPTVAFSDPCNFGQSDRHPASVQHKQS